MSECEWNLADDRLHPRLSVEKRPHQNTGHKIKEQSADNAGQYKVFGRGVFSFQEKCAPNTDCSVSKRGDDGPRAGFANDEVKPSNA